MTPISARAARLAFKMAWIISKGARRKWRRIFRIKRERARLNFLAALAWVYRQMRKARPDRRVTHAALAAAILLDKKETACRRKNSAKPSNVWTSRSRTRPVFSGSILGLRETGPTPVRLKNAANVAETLSA